MSTLGTLIIKLDEANTYRILDVLADELERDSIGAYHLLIEDGTPLDPTDGSPHLAPERDEAMLYAAAPDLFAALDALIVAIYEGKYVDPYSDVYRDALNARAKATKP